MVKILNESTQAGHNGGAARQDRNAWLTALGVDFEAMRGAAATPNGGAQARPTATPSAYQDYSEAAVEAAAAEDPPATAYESAIGDGPADGPPAEPTATPSAYQDYSEAAVEAAAAEDPPATAYESAIGDGPADGPPAEPTATPSAYQDHSEAAVEAAAADGPAATAYESPVLDRSDEPPADGAQARPASTPYALTEYSEAAVEAAAADGPSATAYESSASDRSDEPPADGPPAQPANTPYSLTEYSEAAIEAAAADGPAATADEPPSGRPQAQLAAADSAPVVEPYFADPQPATSPGSAPPAAPKVESEISSPGLKSRALGEKYRGEEQGKGWQEVRKYKGKPIKTKYYSPEEKRASKVDFGQDGAATSSSGKLEGELGFVVDPQTGDIHQFPADQVTEGATENLSMHHSSPLAGAPVAGAGIIEAKGGRITAINDRSGHYKPTADLTFQTVRLIDEKAKAGQSPLRDPATNRETKVSLLGKAAAVSEEEYNAATKEFAEAVPRRNKGEIAAARGKAAGVLSKKTALRQLVGPLGEKAYAGLAKDKKKVKEVLADMEKETGKKPTIEELKAFLGKQAVEMIEDDDRMIGELSAQYGVKSFKPEDVGKGVEPANFAIGKATEVTLTAEQFLQTGGNEAQIRNKALLGKEIESSQRGRKKALDDQAEADTKPEVAMRIEKKILAEEKGNLSKLQMDLRGATGMLSRELITTKIKDCESKIAASEAKIAELKSRLSPAPG